MAAIVPKMMNGVRFPILVFILSERAPNIGRRNTANMLSNDIIVPDADCGRPKWFVKISGIIASYACQNAEIKKKAIPTRIVLL